MDWLFTELKKNFLHQFIYLEKNKLICVFEILTVHNILFFVHFTSKIDITYKICQQKNIHLFSIL